MSTLTPHAIRLLAAVLTVGLLGLAPMQSLGADTPQQATEAMVSEELQLLKEEETVSIAVRHEQPISQAPSNVYVITDEDIRQSGAIDLPTVLRRIPGMEVMQTTGAEFNVSVRGDNQTVANKLLVMVDGRSIYVDVQATVFWKLIPVTLPEIKRIEVLKGPASAVYGFNAFDGIINIITKSPEEMKGTTLQFGGGEFGTISSAAIHAGTVGKLGYRLSVGHDQNQQWRNRDALAFRDNKFNVQTEYALSAVSKVMISGGLVDSNRFDGTVTDVVADSIRPAQGYANLTYERPNFFVRAWWSEYTDSSHTAINPILSNFIRVTDQFGGTAFPFVANTYNIEAQHALEFGSVNRLTYGANYRQNTLSSPFLDVFGRENRLGFYLQDEWKVAQPVTLVGGLRYDMDTFINPTVSPRVALLYRPASDHTMRVSMSIAYRPPTIFETHAVDRTITTLPLPPPFNTSTIAFGPAPNLEPEKIISYEAEYQGWFFRHRVRLRADLFFNHLSNLIHPQPTSPTTSFFLNDPGSADIYGGEAGIEVLATHWLSGFANYSYQEIGQSFTGTALRGAPRFKFNAGLRGEWENGFNGEATFNYYGAATYPLAQPFTGLAPFGVVPPNPRVGSYNLLNLRGAYRFWQQKAATGYTREAEVAVSVFNALNDMHKEHPLGDTIGSRVMGWLTMRF